MQLSSQTFYFTSPVDRVCIVILTLFFFFFLLTLDFLLLIPGPATSEITLFLFRFLLIFNENSFYSSYFYLLLARAHAVHAYIDIHTFFSLFFFFFFSFVSRLFVLLYYNNICFHPPSPAVEMKGGIE